MDIGWPTEELTIVARRILATSFDHEVRRYRQRVIIERKRKRYPLIIVKVLSKRVGCK